MDILSLARHHFMTLAEAAAIFGRLDALSTPAALPTTQRRAGPRPARSKYFPHQSVRECARRVRQMQRAADRELAALFG